MAYGFLALNKDSKVLISSDTKNLFLNSTATYNGVIAATTAGGPAVRLSYIANTSKQPVPLFTHPYSTYTKSIYATFTHNSTSEEVIVWDYFDSYGGGSYHYETNYYYNVSIYLNDISGVSVGQKITFDIGNGMVSAGANYYIVYISGNYIGISTSRNGGHIGASWGASFANASTPGAVTNDPIYVAVTRVTYLGGIRWEIELLVSTTDISIVPIVYIFTEFESTMDRKNSYGMLVVNSVDGGVTYDTRLNPLAIIGTVNVTPPSSPYIAADSTKTSNLNPTAGTIAGLSNNELKPDNNNTYLLSNNLPASPVYYYMSIAQVYKRYDTYIDESYSYDNNTYGKNYVTIHKYTYYQTFCRTGISPSISNGKVYISVGWTVVSGAAGGPTPGQGGYTRDVSDGYLLQGNPGSTYGDDGYWAGDPAQVGQFNPAVGTWLAPQSLNIKSQVVMAADISRNV